MLRSSAVWLLAATAVCVIICVNGSECGISQSDDKLQLRSKRIVHGDRSVPGAWPWAAEVQYWEGNYSAPTHCSATIVHKRWILTAGHCCNETAKVFYGSVKGPEGKSVEAEGYMHDNFPPHDVCLYKLLKPITFDNTTSPVCLSRSVVPRVREIAVVIGFGKYFDGVAPKMIEDKDHRLKEDRELRETFAQIINETSCNPNIPSNLRHIAFCTGSIGKGVLPGDSGGSLLAFRHGKWHHMGVTSATYFSPIKGHRSEVTSFGVFMKTAEYCDWIEEKTDGEVQCAP